MSEYQQHGKGFCHIWQLFSRIVKQNATVFKVVMKSDMDLICKLYDGTMLSCSYFQIHVFPNSATLLGSAFY